MAMQNLESSKKQVNSHTDESLALLFERTGLDFGCFEVILQSSPSVSQITGIKCFIHFFCRAGIYYSLGIRKELYTGN